MIRTKSIFKNLPKATPEIEGFPNPGPADVVCPICEEQLGSSKVCYRLSAPAVLAHYGCETAWVRAETAILLACGRAPKSRTDLAVVVRNGRLLDRVLNYLIDAGRIERIEGRLEERFILDTRDDSEKVIEFLAAASPQNTDTVMVACGLVGARCDHILSSLVESGRIIAERQGLLVWYAIRCAREEAA